MNPRLTWWSSLHSWSPTQQLSHLTKSTVLCWPHFFRDLRTRNTTLSFQKHCSCFPRNLELPLSLWKKCANLFERRRHSLLKSNSELYCQHDWGGHWQLHQQHRRPSKSHCVCSWLWSSSLFTWHCHEHCFRWNSQQRFNDQQEWLHWNREEPGHKHWLKHLLDQEQPQNQQSECVQEHWDWHQQTNHLHQAFVFTRKDCDSDQLCFENYWNHSGDNWPNEFACRRSLHWLLLDNGRVHNAESVKLSWSQQDWTHLCFRWVNQCSF